MDSKDALSLALVSYKQTAGIDLERQQTLESLGLDASESVTTFLTAVRRRSTAGTTLRDALELLLLEFCLLFTEVNANGSLEFTTSGLIPFIALDVLLLSSATTDGSINSRMEVLTGFLEDFSEALQVRYEVSVHGGDVAPEEAVIRRNVLEALLEAMSLSTTYLKKNRIRRYARGIIGTKDGKDTPWSALERLRKVAARDAVRVNNVTLGALKAVASKWGCPLPGVAAAAASVVSSTLCESQRTPKQSISSLVSVRRKSPQLAREQVEDYRSTREIVAETLALVLGTTRSFVHDTVSLGAPLLGIAPVPGLQAAAGFLLSIWDAFDAVEANLKACLRVIQRCAEILRSVRDEICSEPQIVDGLRHPILKLELSFQAVRDFLMAQAKRTFLDRYLRRNEVLREIANCDTRLTDALNSFSISIQMRTLRLIQADDRELHRTSAPRCSSISTSPRISFNRMAATPPDSVPHSPRDIQSTVESIRRRQNIRDQTEDLSQLRSMMCSALAKNSDSAILDVLQVPQDQMEEAIVALRHALDKEDARLRSSGGASRLHPTRWSIEGNLPRDLSATSSRPKARVLSDATDTLDRDFISGSLETLQRLSSSSDQLPQWAISRFEIDIREKVGTGSSGNVYRGFWSGREVAVKVLLDTTSRSLFTREVEVWKTLDHRNVLKLYGASPASGAAPWFFVSPYHRRGNLVQYLKTLGSDSHVDALKIAYGVSEGMAFLHRRGVLHGDLKAANVLVDDELQCIVSDFGQSEMKSGAFQESGSQRSLADWKPGTLRWQAPELMNGTSALTPAADVYAFAITCLEVLARGELPWKLADDRAVRRFVLDEDKRPTFPLLSEAHEPLRQLIEAAWSTNPRSRPSFAVMASDLSALRTAPRSIATTPHRIHLPWINVTTDTVSEALWYLARYPQPNSVHKYNQSVRRVNDGPISNNLPVTSFTIIERSRPRLFALVIGINHYKHAFDDSFHNLSGCVSDADAIERFLKESLHVPRDQITNLRDESATRENILRCLTEMISDDRIRRGDPILVYFAGYGSRANAPKAWAARGICERVDILLPHNFAPWTSDDRQEQGIPVATLAALLSQVARTKGDNITILLDASFSIPRAAADRTYPSLCVRAVVLPEDYTIISTIDRELLTRDNAGNLTASNYERRELLPFSLLTAASQYEDAHESGGHGWFTRALLWALRDPSNRVETISYLNLIDRLSGLPHQHPQCEGLHTSRLLFNGIVSSPGRVFTRMLMDESWKIILEGGKAQGISKNAKFDVYASPCETSRSIGSVVVAETNICSASMERLSSKGLILYCSPLTWAVCTHAGDVFDISIAIYLNNGLIDVLDRAVKEEAASERNTRNIQFVEPHQRHDLAIFYKNGQVFFELTDFLWRENGCTLIDYSVSATADAVYPVIHRAADFFALLRDSKQDNTLAQRVRVRMYAVEEQPVVADTNSRFLGIAEAFRRTHEHHINATGVAVVPIEGQSSRSYGFRLSSTHDAPLFVWVFLFDLSDLSIHELYRPNSRAGSEHDRQCQVIPSLAPFGKLEIGYGYTNNHEPTVFDLPDGRNSDISYLKVYIAEEYIDLSDVARHSPFDAEALLLLPKLPQENVFESVLLAIVQRRTTSQGSENILDRARERSSSSTLQRTAEDNSRLIAGRPSKPL